MLIQKQEEPLQEHQSESCEEPKWIINNLPQHQHALIKPQCLPIRWEMVIILKFFEFWRVHSDHLVEADAGNQLQEVHRLTGRLNSIIESQHECKYRCPV